VFVLTADPASTFRRSKPALESLQLLERVVAAYRLEGGVRFTVLWPLKYGRKFTLAEARQRTNRRLRLASDCGTLRATPIC
jgi:hypothetical protein